MTSQKEIDEQIAKDVSRYNHTIYDGFLPTMLIEWFKKALMTVPVVTHQFNMVYCKKMISKRLDELELVDVGFIINVINSAMPVHVFGTVEEYVEAAIEFQKICEEYNKRNADFEKKILKKRKTLYELGGVTKAAPMPPMGIIKAEA